MTRGLRVIARSIGSSIGSDDVRIVVRLRMLDCWHLGATAIRLVTRRMEWGPLPNRTHGDGRRLRKKKQHGRRPHCDGPPRIKYPVSSGCPRYGCDVEVFKRSNDH